MRGVSIGFCFALFCLEDEGCVLTDLGMGRRTILAMASCSSDSLSIDSTGGAGYSISGIEVGGFQAAS